MHPARSISMIRKVSKLLSSALLPGSSSRMSALDTHFQEPPGSNLLLLHKMNALHVKTLVKAEDLWHADLPTLSVSNIGHPLPRRLGITAATE